MRRIAKFLSLFAVITGCGDGLTLGIPGCGTPLDRPFVRTPENTVEHGVRTTVTSEGLRFLVERREELAAALFDVGPDGHARLPLPDPFTFLDPEAGLGGEVRDVIVDFNLRRAQLDLAFVPGDPPAIRMRVRDARIGLDGAIVSVTAGGDAACRLRNGLFVGTPDEALIVADVEFDVRLVITPDQRFEAQVVVGPYTIHELALELEHDPALPECNDGISDAECPLLCRLADAGADLGEALRGAIQEQLDVLIAPLVQRFVDDLLRRYTGKALSIEGEAHPRLLQALLPIAFDAHPVRFEIAPAPSGFQVRARGDEADGLDFTVDLGLEADDHPCVPTVDGPPLLEAGPPPELTGRGPDGEIYHLGLSVAEAVVNRALWVAYRGGALCLTLDTVALQGLLGQRVDSAALALLLGGVNELTDATARPIMIALDPAFAPGDFPLIRFTQGADVGVPRADGEAALRDLGVSLYVLLEERWSRVFQGRVDVSVALSVSATPDNRLAIAVAPPRIEDLVESYNELLATADLPGLLQLLVDVAANVLVRDGLSLDVGLDGLVSEVTGLSLDARIAALQTEAGFLNVLTTLVEARPGATASCETRASVRASDVPAGRLDLDVSGGDAYQWRVDGGAWRPLRRAGATLRIEDPLLRLRGPHRVSVRAVNQGDYRSLDATPAVVEVETGAQVSAIEAETGGCAVAGRAASPWLLAPLLLALRRRRR